MPAQIHEAADSGSIKLGLRIEVNRLHVQAAETLSVMDNLHDCIRFCKILHLVLVPPRAICMLAASESTHDSRESCTVLQYSVDVTVPSSGGR